MSASVRSTIISQIEQVAEEQKVKLPPLSDELVLLDSGLDSLGFAILVARLEDTLGFDPFTASDDVYFPVSSRPEEFHPRALPDPC
jgi:acyl carrier protein